jgi:hypothetical protein
MLLELLWSVPAREQQEALTTKLSRAAFHAVDVMRVSCNAEGPPAAWSRWTATSWGSRANLQHQNQS